MTFFDFALAKLAGERRVDPEIRPLVTSYRRRILEIDALSGNRHPWTGDRFDRAKADRDTHGQVAMVGSRIVGFLFYRIDSRSRSVELVTIAVESAWQREGIGSALVDHLLSVEIAACPYPSVVARVDAWDIEARAMLLRCGFRQPRRMQSNGRGDGTCRYFGPSAMAAKGVA